MHRKFISFPPLQATKLPVTLHSQAQSLSQLSPKLDGQGHLWQSGGEEAAHTCSLLLLASPAELEPWPAPQVTHLFLTWGWLPINLYNPLLHQRKMKTQIPIILTHETSVFLEGNQERLRMREYR